MNSELFSHRARWQAIELVGVAAVLPCKLVTELKIGLQKQSEHMEGVYSYLNSPGDLRWGSSSTGKSFPLK